MESRALVGNIIEDTAIDSSLELRSSAAANYSFCDLVYKEGYGTLPSYYALPPITPVRHVRCHPTVRSFKDDIGHFDPAGVAELERRLTRSTTSAQRRNTGLSSPSEATLVSDNDPFDFIDCLSGFIKCVYYKNCMGRWY
jgi:hypothetical protein